MTPRVFRQRAHTGRPKNDYSGRVTALLGYHYTLISRTVYHIIGFFWLVWISSIVPIAYSVAGNAKELPSGVGLAMVTTVGYSGFLFGPPIIGFIADWHTLRMALLLVIILFAAMTFLGFRYKAVSHGYQT
jgi:MFS family permease